jgi:hypothetical protein
MHNVSLKVEEQQVIIEENDKNNVNTYDFNIVPQ